MQRFDPHFEFDSTYKYVYMPSYSFAWTVEINTLEKNDIERLESVVKKAIEMVSL